MVQLKLNWPKRLQRKLARDLLKISKANPNVVALMSLTPTKLQRNHQKDLLSIGK